MKLSHPVFAGDTLYPESLVPAKRVCASRPQAGIVTIKTRRLNQDGDEVLSFERTSYVHKRDADLVRKTFPVTQKPSEP